MEPREAATLPVPTFETLETAWRILKPQRADLASLLRRGEWAKVVDAVDEALLIKTLGLTRTQVVDLHDGATVLRVRRMGKGSV